MKKISLIAIAGLAPLLVATSAPTFAADDKLSNKELTQLVQREKDAREVANVMGRRAAWYVQGRGDLVVEQLFAKNQPDVSFSMNGNHILVGYDKISQAFGRNTAGQAGGVRIHSLLSPIIEVAEDGQTAKGFWQTSGPGFTVNDNGAKAEIAWENYAVDFVKEDGEWKIWHLHNITHFYYDLDQTFADQIKPKEDTGRPGPPGGPAAGASQYSAWTPTTATNQIPIPVPYKTFSETFSYGPEAAQ